MYARTYSHAVLAFHLILLISLILGVAMLQDAVLFGGITKDASKSLINALRAPYGVGRVVGAVMAALFAPLEWRVGRANDAASFLVNSICVFLPS
jgi:hypothetical protein